MQICSKPTLVCAGNENGITEDSLQAVQNQFFDLGKKYNLSCTLQTFYINKLLLLYIHIYYTLHER